MTRPPHAGHDGGNLASFQRLILTISAAVLGGAIALRTMVSWAPALRFDVDPVFDPAVFAGLGPAGSLIIDGLIALSAAVILAECASTWALALCLAGGVAGISIFQIHGMGGSGTPWRGATWIAGCVAAAAAVSLAQSPGKNAKIAWSVLVTCLLAAAGAWWVRGLWQWFVEHPAVVEFFHAGSRDAAFFAEQGWDADGPQAKAYVRRLEQREMSGWFGMANIFAGLFAAIAVASVSLGARMASRPRVGMFLCALACAAVPLANGSKGAIVAMAMGITFVVVSRRGRLSPNQLALGALALILLCAFAAPLRCLLPDDALGQERSLLFRGHYIAGAWRIFLSHPWTGSGIDGFQDAFLLSRSRDAVDAVQSAHSVFFDWLAQLGVAGIPMIAVVFALLMAAARGCSGESATQEQRVKPWPRALATLSISLAAIVALRFEAHSLEGMSLGIRLLGAALAGCAAWWLLPMILSRAHAPAVLLAGAAITIWIDAQIEMTMWNPGSMTWGLTLLAASAPGVNPARPVRFSTGIQWFTGVAAVLCAMACFRFSSMAASEEDRMELAARRLVEAAQLAGGEPGPIARVDCARLLLTPPQGREAFVRTKLAALEQLTRASALANNQPDKLSLLRQARAVCEEMGENTFQIGQMNSLISEGIANNSSLETDWLAAVQSALRVTQLDPRCAGAWLRAARWSAKLSQPAAGEYAKRAIDSDDSMAFDALLKLRPKDRLQAERLLKDWPPK